MTDSNDLMIIDRVIAGDVEAFSAIIEKYQNMVFRYVYSQFNNYDEAMDITQDVFIMVIEALPGFRKESKFSTWLYSIMVNYCKNHRKKMSRYSSVPLNIVRDDNEYDLQIPDERENPEEQVIKEESLRIVKEEIQNLPDDFREILVMRDVQGMSYNEISDILDIGLSNVKVRIHRGRELLKNRLHERGLV